MWKQQACFTISGKNAVECNQAMKAREEVMCNPKLNKGLTWASLEQLTALIWLEE